MSHAGILCKYFTQTNCESYLEIGVADGTTFLKLPAKVKVGVDPRPCKALPGVIQTTSDAFFASNARAFDLCFIDGYHSMKQALHDTVHAAKICKHVVLHDTMPPSPKTATPHPTRGGWHGEVWKVCEYLRRLGARYWTVDAAFGLTCIPQQTIKMNMRIFRDVKALTWSYFGTHKSIVLNLVSLEQFLNMDGHQQLPVFNPCHEPRANDTLSAGHESSSTKAPTEKRKPVKHNGSLCTQTPVIDLNLFAYQIHDLNGMSIIKAPLGRQWMDATHNKFAYRCLPMLLANTNGWLITNPARFSVWWKGGPAKTDLIIEFADGYNGNYVQTHFGHGVLTFSLPYLFRTPKSINLSVRGPSNWPKDGIQALEGIVESDWSAATFTMNWKLTRPNHLVHFDKSEPICMIAPIPRGFVERFTPVRRSLVKYPKLKRKYEAWQTKRAKFLKSLADNEPEAVRQGWEKDYFKGANPGVDQIIRDHQTQVVLKEFEDATN